MKRTLGLTIILFLLWLGLSGHMTPLLISLGLASVFLTIYLAHRMQVIDHESHPTHMTKSLLAFWLYLIREITIANIDVVKRILNPGKSISPQLVKLPLPQKTDLGKVIYANAITLTPGTVSIELSKTRITVHAIANETAKDLATGKMAARVPDDVEEIDK
jgi:multicomponent Na+:H+ antiporter subunit E